MGIALLAPALLARTASASEVHVELDRGQEILVYTAGAGEENHPYLQREHGRLNEDITVGDYGIQIEVGDGCYEVPNGIYTPVYRCQGTVQEVRVLLGDGNDEGVGMSQLHSIRRMASGGPGDDDLDLSYSFDSPGPLRLTGGPGDDALVGGEEPTRLEGDSGNDFLIGGAGADTFYGGRGMDTVAYRNQFEFLHPSQPIFVRLDGRGPDGAKGEADRIGPDVEGADGGELDDNLIGNARRNELNGRAGDDNIVGGRGRDRLSGGAGDDRIRSRDGVRDVVGCGSGETDRVLADPLDDVGVQCEDIVVRG